MVPIVVLGGTGDTYMVCALLRAFEARHGMSAKAVVRQQYGCIAEMFRVPFDIDDATVGKAETDLAFQRDYDNAIADGRNFYAHPCMLRTRLRVDHLTTKPDASQGDMYKVLLRIPPATPLALPKIPKANMREGTVLIIPGARSWPHDEPEFWRKLGQELSSEGWAVEVNDRSWPLRQLFLHCAASEWVIGAQCGVMSILVTGRFPCRKTLAVPNIDDNRAPSFLASDTFPYGYVTKFSNFDFDVEEFKIPTSEREQHKLVQTVVHGANAQRLWPHDPRPVNYVTMPLTPGDFLDRLAVLSVKRKRFDPRRRAAIEREYQRHVEARHLARLPEHADLFTELLELHDQNFSLLDRMVPLAMEGSPIASDLHQEAIRANHRRIAIKRAIDARCRAAYTEVKNYYGEDQSWRPQEQPPIEYDDVEHFVPTPEMRWELLPLNVPGQPNLPSQDTQPIFMEALNGVNIVKFKGGFIAIPQQLGTVHIEKVDLEAFPGISRHTSIDAARSAILRQR